MRHAASHPFGRMKTDAHHTRLARTVAHKNIHNGFVPTPSAPLRTTWKNSNPMSRCLNFGFQDMTDKDPQSTPTQVPKSPQSRTKPCCRPSFRMSNIAGNSDAFRFASGQFCHAVKVEHLCARFKHKHCVEATSGDGNDEHTMYVNKSFTQEEL